VPDYDEWMEAQSEERIAEADWRLKELQVRVQKCIFDTFKRVYGEDDYWDRGVLDKEIIKKAFAKQIEYEPQDRLPLENYLDFIEYKKIVENKTHWHLFKTVFDIPEPGEKGKTKNLKWMERVNELRRIPAHATEQRTYKIEDYPYIEYVFDEYSARLESEGGGDPFNEPDAT
jgi:DNA sulfur modification protein DndB